MNEFGMKKFNRHSKETNSYKKNVNIIIIFVNKKKCKREKQLTA